MNVSPPPGAAGMQALAHGALVSPRSCRLARPCPRNDAGRARGGRARRTRGGCARGGCARDGLCEGRERRSAHAGRTGGHTDSEGVRGRIQCASRIGWQHQRNFSLNIIRLMSGVWCVFGVRIWCVCVFRVSRYSRQPQATQRSHAHGSLTRS